MRCLLPTSYMLSTLGTYCRLVDRLDNRVVRPPCIQRGNTCLNVFFPTKMKKNHPVYTQQSDYDDSNLYRGIATIISYIHHSCYNILYHILSLARYREV